MVLVSGRPISYKMNMYEPLYIPRPEVEPEMFASLRPQVYSGAIQPINAGGTATLGATLGVGRQSTAHQRKTETFDTAPGVVESAVGGQPTGVPGYNFGQDYVGGSTAPRPAGVPPAS